MQIFDYIKYKWKKKFGNMNNQNDALLQRYKQQYFGRTYQWTRPINNETVGEMVRVVDVKMRGDMVLLVFNAGTPVNVNLVDSYMRLVEGGDQAPPPGLTGDLSGAGGPLQIPPELQEFTSDKQKISFSAPVQQPQQQQAPPPPKKNEIFALFQSEEKDINLPIRIKMPDMALVKMMYSNAADKDKFLGELAEYVISNINVDITKAAIRHLMGDREESLPAVIEEKKSETNDQQEPAGNPN